MDMLVENGLDNILTVNSSHTVDNLIKNNLGVGFDTLDTDKLVSGSFRWIPLSAALHFDVSAWYRCDAKNIFFIESLLRYIGNKICF